MSIPAQFTLAEAEALFLQRDGGWYLHGSFPNLVASAATLRTALGNDVARAMSNIFWDIRTINSLFLRLEWTTQDALQGRVSPDMWRTYSSLDVEHFWIQIRSVLDYAAAATAAAAERAGSVPSSSMNQLVNWLAKKPSNRDRLGEGLAAVIDTLPDLPLIKDVRDAVVHHGGLTVVFGEPAEGLRVQVYKGNWNPLLQLTDEHPTMVDFRQVASILLANELLFLERLAAAITHRMGVISIGAATIGPGFEILLQWLKRAQQPAA